MILRKKHSFMLFTILMLVASLASCNALPSPGSTTGATPTPTDMAGGIVITQESSDPCENLNGTFELQLLIGPSEAVGLSPYTFAKIPFQVVKDSNSYLVEGGGAVEYYEDILTADWGSFAVTFDGVTSVSGECLSTGDEATLNTLIEMTGQQIVVVTVEGVEYTYPWEGSPQVEASFPLLDGAQVSGEGWALTLHIH